MLPGYTILLYETDSGACPVADFVSEAPVKVQAKIARAIDLLAEYGPGMGMPYVRKMSSADDLWELRVPFGGNAYRIFWFVLEKNTLELVHAIHKKSQKTPQRDIQTALQRMRESKKRRESR